MPEKRIHEYKIGQGAGASSPRQSIIRPLNHIDARVAHKPT